MLGQARRDIRRTLLRAHLPHLSVRILRFPPGGYSEYPTVSTQSTQALILHTGGRRFGAWLRRRRGDLVHHGEGVGELRVRALACSRSPPVSRAISRRTAHAHAHACAAVVRARGVGRPRLAEGQQRCWCAFKPRARAGPLPASRPRRPSFLGRTGQHLDDGAAEGPHVRGRAGVLPADDLRRHPRGRALPSGARRRVRAQHGLGAGESPGGWVGG